jgi:hypothetical protein
VQGDFVNVTEMAIAAAVTLGTVATAAISVNSPALTRQAESTAAVANCRAVDTAILAFYAERQVQPTGLQDIKPYVRGDITEYRIVAGTAVGPGCDRLHGG